MSLAKRKKRTNMKNRTLKNKNNLSTIKDRKSFIQDVLSGNIKVTLQDIKYPISIPNNVPIPLSNQKVCDILSYFNQKGRERKILINEEGELLGLQGLPFMVCSGKCNDNRSLKISVKIMLFNMDDLGSYIDPEEIAKTVSNSLKKRNIDLDLLKIRDQKDITEQNYYEIYGINENELPQNSEIKMIFLLKDLVFSKQTPHINLPIIAYNCNLKDLLSEPTKTEKKILTARRHRQNTNLVNVLISEWCTGGSLEDYLEKNIHVFKRNHLYFDVLFFQLLSLLTTIQRTYPSFRHNDLHLGNLLVEKTPLIYKKEFYLYKIKNITCPNKYTNYVIPNLEYQIRLWDYDLSCIDKIVNNKAVQQAEYEECDILSQKKNQYFDLVKFFFMFDRDIVEEFSLKMKRYHELIYVDILGGLKYNLFDKRGKYLLENDISESGCLNLNIEKITPEILLKKNSFGNGIFKHFIVPENKLHKYKFKEVYKLN